MAEHVDARDRATDQDDPEATPTILVGIVGIVLTFVSVVTLDALFHRVQDAEVARKGGGAKESERRALEAEQRRELTEYAWVDRAEGVVALPIERAMRLVIEENHR